MAVTFTSGGSQSPTSLSRTIEKVLDDSQHTGEINLSGRKLKDYPQISNKYDLFDTTAADLSKNRLSEVPSEVCSYHSIERLNCYHNVIKALPEAITQLCNLVHLNLSRNQLSVIPPFISRLAALEVLLASNNRLVSLPEEIGRLRRLMELDVSCNEVTQLPTQIGDLESLRSLKVRKNLLVELPISLSRLKLRHLDFSCNRIAHIPCDLRKIDSLEELYLDSNPLLSPPAHICTKGRVHVMKFLHMEAVRDERKRGVLHDINQRSNVMKRSSSVCTTNSDDTTRFTRSLADSGCNMSDIGDRTRWSNPESHNGDDGKSLAVKSAESLKEQRRQGREDDQRRQVLKDEQRRRCAAEVDTGTAETINSDVTVSPESERTAGETASDAFTKELQRQKAEYEAKKKKVPTATLR